MIPKKIYLNNTELETFKHRTENGKWDHVLISVEALKEQAEIWRKENEIGQMIEIDELLKFIES